MILFHHFICYFLRIKNILSVGLLSLLVWACARPPSLSVSDNMSKLSLVDTYLQIFTGIQFLRREQTKNVIYFSIFTYFSYMFPIVKTKIAKVFHCSCLCSIWITILFIFRIAFPQITHVFSTFIFFKQPDFVILSNFCFIKNIPCYLMLCSSSKIFKKQSLEYLLIYFVVLFNLFNIKKNCSQAWNKF